MCRQQRVPGGSDSERKEKTRRAGVVEPLMRFANGRTLEGAAPADRLRLWSEVLADRGRGLDEGTTRGRGSALMARGKNRGGGEPEWWNH